MRASDSQITLQDRLEFFFPLGIAGVISWVFSLWHINAVPASFAIAIVFLVGNAFIHSFRRYEAQRSALEAFKDKKIELSARFLEADIKDAHFALGAVRVEVSNQHPTKIAKGVEVKLTELDCPEWSSYERGQYQRRFGQNHLLPRRGDYEVIQGGYNIDQQSKLEFDFFGVFWDTHEKLQRLCVAPFARAANPRSPSTMSMAHDIVVNSSDSPAPKIIHATIRVTCDGCDKIEKRVQIPFLKLGVQSKALIIEESTPPL